MHSFEKALIESLEYSFNNDSDTVTEEPYINKTKLYDAYYKLINIDPDKSEENIYDQTYDYSIFLNLTDLPEYLAVQDEKLTGYVKRFYERSYKVKDPANESVFEFDHIAYFMDESGTEYMSFGIIENDGNGYVIVVNMKTMKYDMRIDDEHKLMNDIFDFNYTDLDLYDTKYDITGSPVLDDHIRKLVKYFK